MEAITTRVEVIATRLEAIALRVEAIATRVEVIATRLEAITLRVEAIATRVEAIAIGSLLVIFATSSSSILSPPRIQHIQSPKELALTPKAGSPMFAQQSSKALQEKYPNSFQIHLKKLAKC